MMTWVSSRVYFYTQKPEYRQKKCIDIGCFFTGSTEIAQAPTLASLIALSANSLTLSDNEQHLAFKIPIK